jgi:hypothetical protein
MGRKGAEGEKDDDWLAVDCFDLVVHFMMPGKLYYVTLCYGTLCYAVSCHHVLCYMCLDYCHIM